MAHNLLNLRQSGPRPPADQVDADTIIEIVESDKVPELEPLESQAPYYTQDGEPAPNPDELF